MTGPRDTQNGAATPFGAVFGAAEIREADARVGLVGVTIERRRQ